MREVDPKPRSWRCEVNGRHFLSIGATLLVLSISQPCSLVAQTARRGSGLPVVVRQGWSETATQSRRNNTRVFDGAQVQYAPAKAISSKSDPQKPGFSSTMKRWGKSVSDKLTYKPRKKVKYDSLSLANMPDRKDPNTLAAMGRLLESKGEFTKAQKAYEEAIKVSPKHLASLTRLARLHHRQGQHAQAIALYQRAAKAHPESAVVQNDLGLCCARSGKPQAALKAMRQAVKLAPTKALYRNNLATILVDLGRTDEALSQFSHGQDQATAHFNVGYLLYHKGQRSGASVHFRRVLELSPNHHRATQMLAKMQASPLQPNTAHSVPAIARRAVQRAPVGVAIRTSGAPNRLQIGRPPENPGLTPPAVERGNIQPPVSNPAVRRFPPTSTSSLEHKYQASLARYDYLQPSTFMAEHVGEAPIAQLPRRTSVTKTATGLILPATYAQPLAKTTSLNGNGGDAPIPLRFDIYSPEGTMEAVVLPRVISAELVQ